MYTIFITLKKTSLGLYKIVQGKSYTLLNIIKMLNTLKGFWKMRNLLVNREPVKITFACHHYFL